MRDSPPCSIVILRPEFPGAALKGTAIELATIKVLLDQFSDGGRVD
jgi:hypothetical protein